MAGSLKDFIYVADDGTEYAIQLDESNTEAVNDATGDYTDVTGLRYTLPSNLEPRCIFFSNAAGTRIIKCIALTLEIYTNFLANQNNIIDPFNDAVTLLVSRLIPEKLKRTPKAADSGLNDGDAT